MLLVKAAWIEPGGDPHQNFHLVEVSADYSQERIRQEILDRLQAQGMEHSIVEFFDPDNVPLGTIPAGSTIAFSKPFFRQLTICLH